MDDIAVEIDGVWKKFKRGERHDSLRDLIPAAARRILHGAPDPSALTEGDFWALQDISFSLGRGQALAIVGHNGAGKSTLLKILTRLLRPNLGSYVTHGRIGALIEVTAGFHPDLTGRENIYLNGAIIGMPRADIARRFDEIVEFSGVSEFLDTPVKRYSSGMNARLGFSIAAHLDPEILIVDEVLSVGDYTFQGKCIQWMQDTLKKGTTVIFVSHNMDAVLSLCDRAILLNHGKVTARGTPQDVIAEYYSGGGAWFGAIRSEPSAHTVAFTSSHDDALVTNPGDRVTFSHTIAADHDCALAPGIIIRRDQRVVAQTTYGRMRGEPLRLSAGDRVTLDWTMSFNFTGGAYQISHYLEDAEGGYHEYTDRARIVILGADPRVKSEAFVDMELSQPDALDEPLVPVELRASSVQR